MLQSQVAEVLSTLDTKGHILILKEETKRRGLKKILRWPPYKS